MPVPNYVASKSAWNAVTPLRILFFWLVIPLIVLIVDIIRNKKDKIEFYDKYVIERSGILSKKEKKSTFAGVYSVSVDQSVWGRIFNYGNVKIDVVGRWDVDTDGIARPNGLKRYLESKIVEPDSLKSVVMN